ncbi:MAG: preprotein translocase subunit SecE [Actinomycetota bacterium]|jgi:preprotein translocase subunit SecE|nr:preprotein translocase subunit SecE [Actinomycetota bacterium]
MKRLMQRQGQIDRDGQPRREAPTRTAPRPAEKRVKAGEYLRQVRAELRKVAWPTRKEVIHYSTIVFVALMILTALIFALDFVFGKGVIWLFES